MLQSIRDHAQGWIAWVIVGLIIITFALFGIDQYAKGDKIIEVAEVNGEPITATEFLTLYNRQKARLQNQFGEMYDQVVKDEELRDQVMDALIESEVIKQWSAEHNMLVSDAQLAQTIQGADVFQKDGQFDQQVYEDVLLRNGLTVAMFEREQRQFLIENQNRQLTMASALSTQRELEALAALQFQERKVDYLRVDQRPFMKKAEITEAQISGYYEQNKAAYITPEMVKLDYLLLSQAEIAKKVAVDDDTLKAFYQDNQDQFIESEQRKASHILVRVDETQSDEVAQQKIADLQKQLKDGADFAKLAKENSDDPGSANMGGDLGFFQQGMMVPEFDKAVFSMNEGEVSEPVKTDFGYHLIKLTAIQPKLTKPYESVKAEVEASYRKQEAEKTYFELLETMNTTAYEQPDSLAPAAELVGLTVQTTEAFSKSGGVDELTRNQKVLTAAFSNDVKTQGMNSASIELSPTSSVIVRIHEVIPERQKTLEEVSESIQQNLKREAGVAASAELAEQLLAELKGGKSLQDVVQEGVELQAVGWVKRENQNMLPQLTQAVFKAPKPSDDKPSYTVYQLPTGDSVIIELQAVKDGQMPEDAPTRLQLDKALTEAVAVAEMQARVDAMLVKADIQRKENYKTLKSN